MPKRILCTLAMTLLFGALFAACNGPPAPTAAEPAAPPDAAAQPQAEDPVAPPDESDFALAPGMEIGFVSTTLAGFLRTRSEVNPDVPGGGTLVTVESLTPEQSVTISWRRTRTESNEQSEDEDAPVTGIGTPAPDPAEETLLVHEEGSITATGLAAARDITLPIYWRPGAIETDTSLLWLSAEALAELKATRTTRWTPDVLTRISQFPLAALEALEAEAEGREFSLHAEGDFIEHTLRINDQPVALQAIRAHDDFGNEYIILADESNPLVVRFTLNAVTTGVLGVDAAVWLLIKAIFSGYEVLEISTP